MTFDDTDSQVPYPDDAPVAVEVLETRLDQSQALMALNRSEIDTQISTAKQYPRSLTKFQKNSQTMALLNQETAATMFYALPRSGKTIQGPSVRMAEVIACNWGNLRYGARIVSIDDSFVTAQGMCFDLENNIASTYESKRRITNREGVRYNDDMIQATCNAACAIAMREAIFKVIPRSLWWGIYGQAKKCAVGEVISIVDSRTKAVAYFAKMGVSEEQILKVLGRHGMNDVTMEDLTVLTGLSTALKDGDATVEGTFGLREDQKAKVKTSPLNDKVGAGAKGNGHATNGNGKTKPAAPTTQSQSARESGVDETEPVNQTQQEQPLSDEENGVDLQLGELALNIEASLQANTLTADINLARKQQIADCLAAKDLTAREAQHLISLVESNTKVFEQLKRTKAAK